MLTFHQQLLWLALLTVLYYQASHREIFIYEIVELFVLLYHSIV